MVIQDLDKPMTGDDLEAVKERRANVVNYFIGHIKTHNLYVFKFIFCEFLNLVNIVGQVSNLYKLLTTNERVKFPISPQSQQLKLAGFDPQ